MKILYLAIIFVVTGLSLAFSFGIANGMENGTMSLPAPPPPPNPVLMNGSINNGTPIYPALNVVPPIMITRALSPLEQLKHGVSAKNVECNEDLLLVTKAEDGSPACITQESISKLILRGWIGTTSHPVQNNVFDEPYQGIEKDGGIVSIKNQTYYVLQFTDIDTAPAFPGMGGKFERVTFSFPYGSGYTPGGIIIPFDMTFPDGTTEAYGKITKNPDGSGSYSGIGLGPNPSSNSTVTVLSDHMHPQAGVTIYGGEIKLLVSTDTIPTNESTQTPDSFAGLKLDLSTDSQIIQSGQSLGIDISVNNTLPAQVKVSNVNAWAYSDLNLDPCIPRPFGIAVFDGYYTEQNMTEGKPLLLFNPVELCPSVNATQSYVFEPLSTHATVSTCTNSSLLSCSYSQDMKDHVSISGYWNQGQLYPFKSGIYTLVGGDTWGHVLMQHFAVTNSTIFAGNLGGMSCPAVQFGIDTKIKNTTGFLPLSSSLNHDNLALDAGKTGTLNLEYNYSHATVGSTDLVGKPLNLTNYAVLAYMANVTSTKPITQYEVTLSPDTSWQSLHVCHYNPQIGGQETPCFPDQYYTVSQIGPGPIPYRPGISVDVEPKWVMISPNSTSTFAATVSTNQTALPGSYWVSVGHGYCGPSDLIELVIK